MPSISGAACARDLAPRKGHTCLIVSVSLMGCDPFETGSANSRGFGDEHIVRSHSVRHAQNTRAGNEEFTTYPPHAGHFQMLPPTVSCHRSFEVAIVISGLQVAKLRVEDLTCPWPLSR